MFDLNRTARIVAGALFDAQATWRSYLAEAGDWRKTAFLLTGPLIVASAVIAWLFGFIGGGSSLYGLYRPTLLSTLLAIVTGALAAGLVAFIFGGLAGFFGGRRSFALGLAATTLAFVPAYLSRAVAWLPWIGWLLSAGLVIYALVLLWRIIPVYLEVPDGKRAGHYIVSLLASVVAVAVLSSVVSRALYGPNPGTPFAGARTAAGSASDGPLDDTIRRAKLVAAAQQDRYTPPADGRLSESQVQAFIRNVERATAAREAAARRLQETIESADRDREMSLGDLRRFVGTTRDIGTFQTAEIEVVKSAGGNWAEHQWVRNALRTARVQRDVSDAVAHNHTLYRQYEERLGAYLER